MYMRECLDNRVRHSARDPCSRETFAGEIEQKFVKWGWGILAFIRTSFASMTCPEYQGFAITKLIFSNIMESGNLFHKDFVTKSDLKIFGCQKWRKAFASYFDIIFPCKFHME